MNKLLLALLSVTAGATALAQTTPPQISPPSGVSPQQGLGTPQAAGRLVPPALINGTAAVPPQASPSPTFPGIIGGGVYGAYGGTSANAPSGTNPGNFSGAHRALK